MAGTNALTHRTVARRAGATALAVLTCLCVTTACASRADGPGPASEPDGWRPWQVSFDGDREDGPSGEVNRCVQGAAPANVPDGFTGEARPTEASPKPDPTEPLHCDGTGFRGEPLDVVDGSHHPEEREREHEGEFARTKDLVLVNEHDADTGERTVRALSGKSDNDQRWKRPVRSTAVLDDGGVIGDERTRITRPQAGDGDDPAHFAPGGDIVSWDVHTGEKLWRLSTPEDEWCSPLGVGGEVFVTCETDEYLEGEVTWYALEVAEDSAGTGEQRAKASLRELTVRDSETGGPQLIGLDDDALVFLPGEGSDFPPAKEFGELVRIDTTTGAERREELPALDTGARPHLIDGDLYFEQEDGRELVVVDASSGEERWRQRTGLTHASRPTVSTSRDEVYLVDPSGRMTALDRKDGEELWHTSKPRAADGGTDPDEMDALSSVTLVEDVLVVSTGDTVFSVSPENPEAEPDTEHIP